MACMRSSSRDIAVRARGKQLSKMSPVPRWILVALAEAGLQDREIKRKHDRLFERYNSSISWGDHSTDSSTLGEHQLGSSLANLNIAALAVTCNILQH